MKVDYTSRDGRMSTSFEGSNCKEIFEKMATFQEIFENLKFSRNGQEAQDIRLCVRTTGDNTFYEAVVHDDHPDLRNFKRRFGVIKTTGELFPKRTSIKDDSGEEIWNDVWVRYDHDKSREVGANERA